MIAKPLQLRNALSQHLGGVLTPEVAADIERQSLHIEDHSIDPARFAPLILGAYSIQMERLRDIVSEVKVLHDLHWQETEMYRHGLGLAMDYEGMIYRERIGKLVQLTIRQGQDLVGQIRLFLSESSHTGTTLAEEDVLFIAAEHRGKSLADNLILYGERVLFDGLDVSEIRVDTKMAKTQANALLERHQYLPVSTKFVKVRPSPVQKSGGG